MKLFKKLTAIALAAVLALAMVGCGSANTSAKQAEDIMNLLEDYATVSGANMKHEASLDEIAAALITESNNAYEDGDDVEALLTDDDVAEAAGIAVETEGYYLTVVENYSFKSSVMSEQRNVMLAQKLMNDSGTSLKVGNPPALINDLVVGIAIGKVGAKEYVVLVCTTTAAFIA